MRAFCGPDFVGPTQNGGMATALQIAARGHAFRFALLVVFLPYGPMSRVFVSYSHDSAQHEQRVLELANALRANGVDVELDRYHVRPEKGWPHWCEAQLRPESSDFVLMICTETYLRRV